MKKETGAKIYFKSNKITMFGKVQDLHFTTSGHYCIHLNRKHKILNYENQNTSKVVFTNTLNDKTFQKKNSVAVNLHKPFCHPRTFRLKKLLQGGSVDDFFNMLTKRKSVHHQASCVFSTV